MSLIAGQSFQRFIYNVRHRVIPNLPYLLQSKIRICGACRRRTVILAFGPGDEFRLCLRCRANLRYEMLAEQIRRIYPDLSQFDVLELDFASPLRSLLSRARSYARSYYRDGIAPGTAGFDGAVCEDITRLTFADDSLDLIVSSDVLEHVPNAAAAFVESARVLRPGGVHIFTVPSRPTTRVRATLRNGHIEHLLPAEYHSDPLDPAGVLVYWDFGPDIGDVFECTGLTFRIVSGPKGADGRIVWQASKAMGPSPTSLGASSP